MHPEAGAIDTDLTQATKAHPHHAWREQQVGWKFPTLQVIALYQRYLNESIARVAWKTGINRVKNVLVQ